jgi:hypothetical protein
MPKGALSVQTGNCFDRMEIAGAFGDPGTLVPFIVAYRGGRGDGGTG